MGILVRVRINVAATRQEQVSNPAARYQGKSNENSRLETSGPKVTSKLGIIGIKDLTRLVDRDELQYIGGGTFGDVYRGRWVNGKKEDGKNPDIVIKVLRSTGSVESSAFGKDLKVGNGIPF
jgi:hypothetical protein